MSDAKRQIEEQLEEIAIQEVMADSQDYLEESLSRYLETTGAPQTMSRAEGYLAGYKAAMRWCVDNMA